MPVAEIIVFTPSDAYKADSNVLNDALVQLSGIDGVQSSYRGYVLEEPKKVIWAIVYDTYEAHRSFAASSTFPNFLAACRPAMASKPEPIHVNLTADLTEILSAPLTLFGFITLKPGQKKDVPLVDSVVQEFRRAEGIHGVTWGASVQKDDFFVFLAGWESREARDKAVAEGTPCHAIITKIAETANLSRNFVALDKF
jgi:quinol monooxygenase YgiN